MKLAWATDLHLDMAGDLLGKINQLSISSKDCDAVLLTGDISISNFVVQHLSMLETMLEKPIYFVLGNHDYYGSSFNIVRKNVVDLCRSSSYLRYMTATPYIKLGDGKYLVGHDGWYDAQNGNPHGNSIFMNDWMQISNYNSALRGSYGGFGINKNVIIDISRRLAQDSVNHIANAIKAVIKNSEHIIVMTHVPPFRESFNAADKYRGVSVMEVIPWYTSKIMGDTLIAAAKAYPGVKFTVLSGHVHSHYDDDLLNNLNVKVGRAIYGNPQLANKLSI